MRVRQKDDDLQKAIVAYKQAININKKYAPAYKGLGRIYQKQKKHNLAVEAYKTYLTFDDQSSDAAYIKSYVNIQDTL